MEAQLEHAFGSVCLSGSERDSQLRRDLFVRFPLGQETNDFDLARSCSSAGPLALLMPARCLEKSFQDDFGIQKIGPQLILFDLSEGITHSPETVKTLKQPFRGVLIFGLIDESSYELERGSLLPGVSAVFTKKDDSEGLIRNIQVVLQRAN
jgi:hypothetical protein